MTLQSSGTISFGNIANEFGLPPGRNFGAYRVNQSIGSLGNLPLSTGVPQSGPISFSNFYNKSLNMVVDYFTSGDGNIIGGDARRRYNAGRVVVVGGFRSRPSSTSNTKVIIHLNDRTAGSSKGNRNSVALKTGNWDSGTNLQMVIGPAGAIYGAGGDGGGGNGGNGGQGTSALGIQYPVALTNQGTIVAGRGGGGGGGIGRGFKHANTQRGCQGRQDCIFSAGGGGAGGRGFPGGNGGPGGGDPGSCRGTFSGAGSGGSGNTGGSGGGGAGGRAGEGRCISTAVGGNGGGAESSGGTGSGVPSGGGGTGGSGGNQGYAIIIDSSGSLISYAGNGADGAVVNGSVL